jgi:hypothetical protein
MILKRLLSRILPRRNRNLPCLVDAETAANTLREFRYPGSDLLPSPCTTEALQEFLEREKLNLRIN